MVGIVLEVFHIAALCILAFTISHLYDRIDALEDREAPGDIEAIEEWRPVNMTDEREFEIQQQEIKRGYFN